MKKLIYQIMEKRIFCFLILLFITIAGIMAYRDLKIDVLPDPSPVLVQVLCDAEGMAPEEVEKFVSYPIETSLYGLPRIRKVTSLSSFGLSTVNVYFEDGMDLFFARQLVAEQLPAVSSKLPAFVEPPVLGPITTGLGMVYIYALTGDRSSLELRTLNDWVVKFRLQTIPGVAAVLSQGGEVKQFQVMIDPRKLAKYGLDLYTVVEHIKAGSANITAGYIVKNKEEYVIRGIGLLEDMGALKKVMVKTAGATPVFLESIAAIEIGPALKRGDAELNTQGSTVSGMVMKLTGINTAELIGQIDRRLQEINAGLPPGVRVVPVYNQGLIIKAAFRTVSEALFLGIILVILILFLFVDDIASALVSTLSIPFAVFVTFIIMLLTRTTADLMSFGGLAIGIGLLVDAAVVVTENIARNRDQFKGAMPDRDIIWQAVSEVLRPLIYAMLIIILSFAPLITLQGVEGKLFKPFGFTLLLALVAAIFYAVFISPVLMNILGTRKFHLAGFFFAYSQKIYLKAFDLFYNRERLTIILFAAIFLVSIGLLFFTGSEFLPVLNEQTLQMEMTLPQNTSLEESRRMMHIINQELTAIPGISQVFGLIGRGEEGTHAHPVNTGKTIIHLDERQRWTVPSQTAIIHKIQAAVKRRTPGVLLNFTQPIKHNLDQLLTGVRADLAIKIYGSDYPELQRLAAQVEGIMSGVKGAQDIQVSRFSGQNEIAVRLKIQELARYGLKPAEVLDQVQVAIGGRTVSRIYQGDMAYDVFVQYAPPFRQDIKDLGNLLVHAGSGGPDAGQLIPLSSLASIAESSGYTNIEREDGKRYITVQCNARGRDIGSIVSESREKISSQVKFPPGYFATWGGQFELKQSAEKRLYLVLIITLFLVIVILFDFLKNWKDILVIMINLPVSLSGGIISLWLAGAYFSVPSTIGFLALLGIALENTLILISFFKEIQSRGVDFDSAMRQSVALRLRPILMTKFTTIIGLVPLLFSTGIGSEIQKPLAIVVLGGIFFSIFTTLLLMPVAYKKFYRL